MNLYGGATGFAGYEWLSNADCRERDQLPSTPHHPAHAGRPHLYAHIKYQVNSSASVSFVNMHVWAALGCDIWHDAMPCLGH